MQNESPWKMNFTLGLFIIITMKMIKRKMLVKLIENEYENLD